MSERILNVAIIGQGRSGRDIHGAFFRSERNTRFRVAAVVDALENRRVRAAEEYGCDVYADYHELFGRTDIDVVVNATFSHQHAPITIDLLEHGFNVICEKPFAKTYEDGCRVIEAAKKAGRMVNAFQQSRFAPYYTAIREILDRGELGELMQVSISFSGYARRWDWQTSKAFAAGGVRNTGPHPLDQAMDILGFPENPVVFSRLGRANTAGDAEDYAKILLSVPGKPLLDVEISSCNGYNPYTYVVQGTRGCLRATQKKIEWRTFDPEKPPLPALVTTPLENKDGLPCYCSETLSWQEHSLDVEGDVFTVGVKKYYDMIYDHLVSGKPMAVTPEQVLTQLKVIDLVHAQNPMPVR